MPEEKSVRSLPMYNAQEERLQRAEQTVADHGAKIAETAAAVEFLGQRIDAGFENLCEKLDRAVAPLAAKVSEAGERLEALGDAVHDQRKGLDTLQGAAQRGRERWDGLKKFLVPVVAGTAAIGLKELVVWLANH